MAEREGNASLTLTASSVRPEYAKVEHKTHGKTAIVRMRVGKRAQSGDSLHQKMREPKKERTTDRMVFVVPCRSWPRR